MFELTARRTVPALRADVEAYRHPASGAQHIHVSCDDAEMAFLVGFPTRPMVSDGRAHILEHLCLCGSARYPVADPFFAMLRRSTATFMNAMTYADRTAYPFASTNEADFFNLLDVYLDATFFPKLERLSFLQEGWRHTVVDGKLGLQGVVLNEMKGVFADPTRSLSLAIHRELFAGTTYAVDSGGDPLLIPQLDFKDLKAFHASHYDPAHAVFMTWGRVDRAKVQARIAERVLSGSPRTRQEEAKVSPPSWTQKRTLEVTVPAQAGQAQEFGAQIAWRLGERGDPKGLLQARLLSRVLLGDASAPLMAALQSMGFGRPGPLLGLDTQARELVFHAGMAGLTEAQVPLALQRIQAALEAVAERSLPSQTLTAIVRDMRYAQRQSPGGRIPTGVVRLLTALPLAMDGAGLLDAFDAEPGLRELEQCAATPAGFAELLQQMLASPTCLNIMVKPDPDFHSRRLRQEQAWLASSEHALDDVVRQRIQADEVALAEVQQRTQDLSVLPRIRPSDVGRDPRALPTLQAVGEGAFVADLPSNGITYSHVTLDVSGFPAEDWPWLGLYASLLPSLGAEGRSHAESSEWRRLLVSDHAVALEALTTLRGELRLQIVHSASALEEAQDGIAPVLHAWVQSPRFDEHDRLAFLIRSQADDLLSNLVPQGNRLALLAATAPLAKIQRFEEAAHGIGAIRHCAALRQQLATPQGIYEIAARLSALHEQVRVGNRTMVCAGNLQRAGVVMAALQSRFPSPDSYACDAAAGHPVMETPTMASVALHLPAQVNHCSAAWAVARLGHADAPVLAVAAKLIGQQLLHRLLREQGGAYGASATYGADSGVFAMSSFSDPRLAATYADFASALAQAQDSTFTTDAVEEAIVSVISELDRPGPPQSDLRSAWRLLEQGIDDASRRQFRAGVLQCSLDEIRRAVRTWLVSTTPSRAAAAGKLDQDLAGLVVVHLETSAAPRP